LTLNLCLKPLSCIKSNLARVKSISAVFMMITYSLIYIHVHPVLNRLIWHIQQIDVPIVRVLIHCPS
jgi:hypothetical protein